jgi:hypothetical protein
MTGTAAQLARREDPTAFDPYAMLRRKLSRMAPLVDLDATLARRDVDILEVRDNDREVLGIAVIRRDTPQLQLQLYYADDAQTAAALMARLNALEH